MRKYLAWTIMRLRDAKKIITQNSDIKDDIKKDEIVLPYLRYISSSCSLFLFYVLFFILKFLD